MDMNVFPLICAVVLLQGLLLFVQSTNGLVMAGRYFKFLPAFENPDVRAEKYRKVKLFMYDRAPTTKKGRRSTLPTRGDYRLITNRNMDDMIYKLNTSLSTLIFIHGFMEPQEPNVITELISAMKQTNRMNIILVDWHVLSAGPWYPWAVLNVPVVGRYLAYFIDSLARRIDQKGGYGDYDNEIIRRKRLSSSSSEFFQNLHIVGFSLGAHVAGIAGYHVTEGRIGRITGIEPAYPMVNLLATDTERLDSSDAEFVDVIHSCSGSYGVPEAVGHVDFYPNGGKPIQPGCENVIAKYSCSHWKAWDYFAESALNEKTFEALPCQSWKAFTNGKCRKQRNDFTDEPVYMGFYTRRTARGKYYLRTNASPPYSIPLRQKLSHIEINNNTFVQWDK